jgi:hypothetical protein
MIIPWQQVGITPKVGDKMRKWDSPFLMGVILLVLWVSHLPYLLEIPLVSTSGIQKLSRDVSEFPEWLKDEAELSGKSQSDIETGLITSCRIAFAKSLLLYLLGILSGVLVLKRHRSGRFLAIGLSIYVLLLRIVSVAFRGHSFHRLYRLYTFMFSRCPFRVIHLDIVTSLVLLVALVHLLRPSIAKQFEKNESDER